MPTLAQVQALIESKKLPRWAMSDDELVQLYINIQILKKIIESAADLHRQTHSNSTSTSTNPSTSQTPSTAAGDLMEQDDDVIYDGTIKTEMPMTPTSGPDEASSDEPSETAELLPNNWSSVLGSIDVSSLLSRGFIVPEKPLNLHSESPTVDPCFEPMEVAESTQLRWPPGLGLMDASTLLSNFAQLAEALHKPHESTEDQSVESIEDEEPAPCQGPMLNDFGFDGMPLIKPIGASTEPAEIVEPAPGPGSMEPCSSSMDRFGLPSVEPTSHRQSSNLEPMYVGSSLSNPSIVADPPVNYPSGFSEVPADEVMAFAEPTSFHQQSESGALDKISLIFDDLVVADQSQGSSSMPSSELMEVVTEPTPFHRPSGLEPMYASNSTINGFVAPDQPVDQPSVSAKASSAKPKPLRRQRARRLMKACSSTTKPRSKPTQSKKVVGSTSIHRPPGLGPVEAESQSIDESHLFCEVCGFACHGKFHFQSHMNTHSEHKCRMCDYTSRTVGRLEKHMNQDHTDEERRRAGLEPVPSSSTMREITVNPTRTPEADGFLDESPTDEEGWNVDLESVEEQKDMDENFEVLDEFFKTKIRSIPGPSSLNQLVEISENPVWMPEADLADILSEASKMTPEEPVAQQTSKSGMKVKKCKQTGCLHTSLTKEEHWNHMRTHIPAERQLNCSLCGFVTEFKQHMQYHSRVHNNEKPYKCKKCIYSGRSKSMLNSHMKCHNDEYQYKCIDCKYETKYPHSITLHLKKYKHRMMPPELQLAPPVPESVPEVDFPMDLTVDNRPQLPTNNVDEYRQLQEIAATLQLAWLQSQNPNNNVS